MSQRTQLSRDDLNKAYNDKLPVHRNGNMFIIAAMYYNDQGIEPKWLIDYYKISNKVQRVRTRDLISFCRSFSLDKE